MASRLRIGLLTEDRTDSDTLTEIVRRVVGDEVGVRRRYGGGCSQLVRKAAVWMAELADDGCSALVLVHDLDRNPANNMLNNEAELRRLIARATAPAGLRPHICIPIEELEAWFWSDPEILERIAPGLGRAQASPAPHTIQKPKEKLWHLSARAHRNARYTPQFNRELARSLNLDLCAQRCPAFRDLRAFLSTLRPG
jgi:hypothetical protein